MKKGIILLALLFTACVNLENIGGNSGGDIKEIKTTNINISKNYERKNGVLYVDNVLANGKQEYKEKNGVIIDSIQVLREGAEKFSFFFTDQSSDTVFIDMSKKVEQKSK